MPPTRRHSIAVDAELLAYLDRRFDDVDRQFAELRTELGAEIAGSAAGLRTELRADIAASAEQLRAELRADIAASAEQLRAELRADIAASAEQLRAELRADIAASAEQLRAELRADIAASADQLRAELRADIAASAAETRRYFYVLAEDLTTKIELVAEGVAAVGERLDRFADEVRGEFGRVDRRFLKLETQVAGLAR